MVCQSCKHDNNGTCLMQVNINMYYEEGGDEVGCPHYRTVERLALWASRHPLDAAAKAAMEPYDRIEMKEILWPEGLEECLAVVRSLVENFDFIYGVFPGQAIEAIMMYHWSPSHRVFYPGKCKFFSPVSCPVREPDTGKVRSFEFVRWARLI